MPIQASIDVHPQRRPTLLLGRASPSLLPLLEVPHCDGLFASSHMSSRVPRRIVFDKPTCSRSKAQTQRPRLQLAITLKVNRIISRSYARKQNTRKEEHTNLAEQFHIQLSPKSLQPVSGHLHTQIGFIFVSIFTSVSGFHSMQHVEQLLRGSVWSKGYAFSTPAYGCV